VNTRPSPFDPYLRRFLDYLRHHSATFSPSSTKCLAHAAEEIDVDPALVEALFASASSRGLLRPARAPRGKSRWAVSRKGDQFLAAYASTDDEPG
jgi:hypothetical protein